MVPDLGTDRRATFVEQQKALRKQLEKAACGSFRKEPAA